MKFSELIRLLEKNGFHLLKFVTMPSQDITGWSELIFTARRKFPQAHVMLFLRQLESRKGLDDDD